MEDISEYSGLTSQEVSERIQNHQVNEPVDPGTKTNKDIIKGNLLTYFNMIFLILAVLVCVAGSFRSLTFLPVVIGNALIGIIQEIRARDTLAKMKLINAPHTKVIRDGKKKKIMSEQLVVDDLAIFTAGDQIPADAVITSGSVKVNESLLTGESDEIEKGKNGRLLSGSFIVSGECRAVIEKVGKDSYISRLTLEAKSEKKQELSEMIRSINNLIKWVGIVIIPIGIILFYQGYFVNKESFSESIVSMVAAVIGMIPEGLYLLTTIALAVSTMRLAKQSVLLHDMKSIETLARVDVLCVDKTGTITENTMSVSDIISASDMAADLVTEAAKELSDKGWTETLAQFCMAMTADNITMKALKAFFKDKSDVKMRKPDSITSFSSEVKYCGATYKEEAYILGAPDAVLGDAYDNYSDKLSELQSKGYRILAFGSYDGVVDGKPLTGTFTPLGFITLTNPIRKQAKKTFQYFDNQGVSVMVISGDNPETASEVAAKAGIKNAEKYIDARKLKNTADIDMAVRKYTVFGRVTPKQKKQIVNSLKKQGHTVAMTGDGVNDILALRDADCSVAFSSGSDAAAQAAQVVLLDSDFAHMPSVVMEGRRVVNNVQRSASLFLVKNIFSLLMSLFAAVLMVTYPLEPSQISLISMFNIGIPAFFLAMESNGNRIEGKFLKNVFLKALPAGLTDALAIAALVVCGKVFGLPSEDIATAATMLLAIVGFMILFKISVPLNKYRGTVLVCNMIAFVLCAVVLNELFAIKSMSRICVLLFVVFSFAAESLFRILSHIVENVEKHFARC
ncbi:MAG: HAD-IC family P-type ATPase [Lachnospira sp.]|nr:HAD-IC family P-type ATPase [Lachnospira sp.]